MMPLILLLNLLVFATFSLVKYEECSILVHKKDINKLYLFQLIGFAGWTTYGMGAVAGRNQGTAIILNHFFGTVINAAYGISFQVFGAISFVVTSIMNAINPQIMKAEGGKDRKKMLMLACKECKFSASLLSIVVIPFLFEMPTILEIWLEEVPTHTALFCRFVLVSFIFDQTTLGLQTANQAIGNIRKYTLLTYTPKLLYLLIIWLMLKHGCSVDSIMWCYLFIEIYVAAQRVPLLKKEAGLSIKQFGTQVISKIIPVCLFECVCCMICQSLVKGIRFSLLITLVITIITGIISAWFFTLTSEEQLYVTNTLKK
jgi:O-antigen/teichoic acid export membrane protein